MKFVIPALDAAVQAFLTSKEGGGDVEDGVCAAIEAYEAERWRPIEEAPRDGTTIQIYSTTGWTGGWGKPKGQCIAGYYESECFAQHEWAILHEDLIADGAMFRTIDPPSES